MRARSFTGSIIGILGFLVLSGCPSADDQLRADAAIQGEASVDAGRRAEQSAVAEMERRLDVLLVQSAALGGRFSGSARLRDGSEMRVTVRLAPTVSVPRNRGARTRDEVLRDLERVAVRTELRVDAGAAARFSCAFGAVRPDSDSSALDLSSASCPYSVRLLPTDGDRGRGSTSPDEVAVRLTEQLRDGKSSRFESLRFDAISTVNGLTFGARLKR